jgi:hypothetical protein
MDTTESLRLSVVIENLKKEIRELKDETRLTDFRPQELQIALDAICVKQAEAQYIVTKSEEMGIEPAKAHKEIIDHCQLWATQLIAAMSKVVARDLVNAN